MIPLTLLGRDIMEDVDVDRMKPGSIVCKERLSKTEIL